VQNRRRGPSKKSLKFFKKKLASALANDLDRTLSGQMGAFKRSKKNKKKLVSFQKV
jgi:hypothetical protein